MSRLDLTLKKHPGHEEGIRLEAEPSGTEGGRWLG